MVDLGETQQLISPLQMLYVVFARTAWQSKFCHAVWKQLDRQDGIPQIV
jgi:hypothetical protein